MTGAQIRYDDVETSLFHASKRKRVGMCFGAAAYAEADVAPAPGCVSVRVFGWTRSRGT